MSEGKRFEDWIEVDCNECAHYWDNSCDGAKTLLKGSRKPCNAFMATRSVLIPEQLKRLERAIKLIWWALLCFAISIGIHYVNHWLGVY